MLSEKFINFLQEYYSHILPMGDKGVACLAPYIHSTAIVTVDANDFHGISNRWCYSSKERARAALLAWARDNFKGEPEGWHRHPHSGRRRPEGNAEQEYINF